MYEARAYTASNRKIRYISKCFCSSNVLDNFCIVKGKSLEQVIYIRLFKKLIYKTFFSFNTALSTIELITYLACIGQNPVSRFGGKIYKVFIRPEQVWLYSTL